MEQPNLEGPVNTSTAGTVDEGGQLSLTGHLVSTDADSPNQSLVYTLLSLPGDGALKLNDSDLAVGGTFTQKDIIDGNVSYVHNGTPNSGDSFDWELTDGMHQIPQNTFAITVSPTNDAPIVVNNMASDIDEGGTGLLSPDIFSTSDEESGTMTYTFVSTVRGMMQRRVGAGPYTAMAAGDTFTVQDVVDGNIRYVDPGTDDAMLQMQQNTTASFSWRGDDGQSGEAPSATGAFVTNFNITSVDDPPVFSWRTAVCALPGNNVLTNPLLSFADVDNTAAQYTVCLVSVGVGYTVVNSLQTITQIPLVVQNGATNMAIGGCLAANALTSVNVDSTAGTGTYTSANRGTVQWKLMKGATQFGAVGSMTLPVKAATPCP